MLVRCLEPTECGLTETTSMSGVPGRIRRMGVEVCNPRESNPKVPLERSATNSSLVVSGGGDTSMIEILLDSMLVPSERDREANEVSNDSFSESVVDRVARFRCQAFSRLGAYGTTVYPPLAVGSR